MAKKYDRSIGNIPTAVYAVNERLRSHSKTSYYATGQPRKSYVAIVQKVEFLYYNKYSEK